MKSRISEGKTVVHIYSLVGAREELPGLAKMEDEHVREEVDAEVRDLLAGDKLSRAAVRLGSASGIHGNAEGIAEKEERKVPREE